MNKKPVKDDKLLVWDNNEAACKERIFVGMLEGQYICKGTENNPILIGWLHAKPAPKESAATQTDYDRCVEKLDNCRACLVRIAEKLGLEVTQSDELNTEWYDWLIKKLDGWSE